MHRSGTSFLTRALNLCGLELPDPNHKGNQWNAKGRWENIRLSKAARPLFGPVDRWDDPRVIHNTPEVLSNMRTTLDTVHKSAGDVWGWKDPRTLITFDSWKKVLPSGACAELIISLRNPLDVAQSLLHRNGFELSRGLRLWQRYNDYALWYLDRGERVHLFNFSVPNKEEELRRLCHRLGLTPNPEAWEQFFEQELVHYDSPTIPHILTYERLLKHWQSQAPQDEVPLATQQEPHGNEAAEGVSIQAVQRVPTAVSSTTLPRLRLAVLIVNGTFNYRGQLWIEQCVERLVQYTSAYTDFKIFIWNHDWENRDVTEYLSRRAPYVTVLDEAHYDWSDYRGPTYDRPTHSAYNFHGFHVHRTPLQILFDHVTSRYDVDTVFTFDSDSWPIRYNWDVPLLYALDRDTKLAGVWRDELVPIMPAFVHASGLGIRVETIRELGLRFDYKPENEREDTLSNFTRSVEAAYGPEAICRLRRSNVLQYHPIFGGVYDGTIYHHHLGSRYQEGRNKKIVTRGWEERGESLDHNRLVMDGITEAVFSHGDSYLLDLAYGERAAKLKLHVAALRANPCDERYAALRELAYETKSTQAEAALFLYNLVCKYYAFNSGVLTEYADLCTQLCHQDEAAAYKDIAVALDCPSA